MDGSLHVNNNNFMVASRLYVIITMISACFMAPQLVGNIFLVLISKPVRVCFATANRMIQVRSIIMKNSIKKVPYVALKKDYNGTYGWKEVMALRPCTCVTPLSFSPRYCGHIGTGNLLCLLPFDPQNLPLSSVIPTQETQQPM